MRTHDSRGQLRDLLPRIVLATLVALTVLSAVRIQQADAFEILSFGGGYTDAAGAPMTQAGSHPDLTTKFLVSAGPQSGPDQALRDIKVDFPAGLVIDPSATPRCSQAHLIGENGAVECSGSSQVGILKLDYNTAGIFNMVPGPELPGRFAANIGGVIVNLDAAVRTGGDYGISSLTERASETLVFREVSAVVWGVPGDPVHDPQRLCPGDYDGCGTNEPPKAMVSMPADCSSGPLLTSLAIDTWQEPGVFATAAFDDDLEGNPIQPTGCERIQFEPRLSAQPESHQADSPTGFDVSLTIPQNQDPDGYATAMLNRANVTLPEGMAINPSSAAGQESCSPAQIALKSASATNCPDASKIAAVTIETPLLEKPLTGSVYLAKQGENPFGSTLAMYLVAEGPGVVIKVPGKISPDSKTGRLTTTFVDNPQLPFEVLTLRFKGGPRAPLVNPPSCGTYTTTGEFVPWSAIDKGNPNADELRTSSDSFRITSGPNGAPCPNGSFKPALEAGSTNPLGGEFSPFVLRLTRPDGSERFKSLSVTMPKGLLGKLAGIPYCPDAALAAVSGAEGTGQAQLASPSCPSASQVGKVTVGAGAGSNPFYAQTGKAYLAGPYKGAPLSLAAVVPAVAGPFDLGSVVVRNALEVNPETAQITAVSDPIPTILHGIPLDVRDIGIEVDRDGFTLNPTNCDPSKVTGTATATNGAAAALENRFQALGCGELGFKPKLALSLSGAPTRRGGYPKLRAELTMPKGANIQRAQVLLPKTELLENSHIRTICTRVQYAAGKGGGAACPQASVYGYAKAWTPLLDKPLEGPVYLRSSSHQLPDLVASLDGQIHVDLVGRIDAKNARIRNTFESVPDAPVSKFVLTMQGGKKGLLANNTDLCKTTPRANATFLAQNGKEASLSPVAKVACKGKASRKKR